MASRLLYGEEQRLLPWAAERTGGGAFRSDAVAIGLERDGEIAAVVVFDNFSEVDCSMHIASDGSRRWMSKDLLLAAFAYPFQQLKCRRITGMVAAKNTQALAFDEHLGFEREGLCRNALPDDDLVILGMLKERCRFIPQDTKKGAIHG